MEEILTNLYVYNPKADSFRMLNPLSIIFVLMVTLVVVVMIPLPNDVNLEESWDVLGDMYTNHLVWW